MSNRLAEIEERLNDPVRFLETSPHSDAEWLIREVKRLRACIEHMGNVAENAALDTGVAEYWWFGEEAYRALSGLGK